MVDMRGCESTRVWLCVCVCVCVRVRVCMRMYGGKSSASVQHIHFVHVHTRARLAVGVAVLLLPLLHPGKVVDDRLREILETSELHLHRLELLGLEAAVER